MTTCTNVLFPKQLFQKRTKAYLGIHVTHSCMYSKEVLCAGDCARACASRRWVGSGHRTSSTGRKLWHAGPILSNPPQHHRPGPWPWGGSLSSACSSPSSDKNSASVHSIAVWHLQQTVHSKLAYRCCHIECLQIWVIVFRHCVQLLLTESTILHHVSNMCLVNENCSYFCATCVLASVNVYRVTVNVFRHVQMCLEFCNVCFSKCQCVQSFVKMWNWGEMCLLFGQLGAQFIKYV